MSIPVRNLREGVARLDKAGVSWTPGWRFKSARHVSVVINNPSSEQASAPERQRPTEGKDEHPGLQGMLERAARIRDKLAVATWIRDGVPGGMAFGTSSSVWQALFAKMRTLFRLKNQDSNLA